MINVAILAYDNLATFEFGCAIEIFGLERPEFKDWYRTEAVALYQETVQSRCNLKITVKQVENFEGYDLLIIPGWCVDDISLQNCHPELISALSDYYQKGGRILSFCTGAFLLAEAGLLDGREVTTHWRYAEKFKKMYPNIIYKENVLYVYDGRIGCSAGSAAALDLGLEVVRQDFDHDKANQVARRLVIPPHRSGGQAQFVETPIIPNQSHFSSTLDWAIGRLNTELDVDTLAEKAKMSRRTFDRHFRASVGMSPKEWIIRQRLHLAQKLLGEKSQESMERVAQQSGFETAMNMRHHFRKTFGVSPTQYQTQFSRGSLNIQAPIA